MPSKIWTRSALVFSLAAFSLATRAGAQNPNPPAPARPVAPNHAARPPADPAKMAALLAHWEQNSDRLKSLDVMMTRTDNSPAWPEPESYKGRALLKSPNLAFLDFQKEEADPNTGKKVFAQDERIICTGNEVWQYKARTKQIFIYPLEKDEKQRALEEGPLPFLFNFRANDAQKHYHMTLLEENETAYLIMIVPRLEIDRESFTKALVQLDRKFHLLPSRIMLFAPDGKSTKDFKLSYPKDGPNKVIPEANFVGKTYPGWKVVRNPGVDAGPARVGSGAGNGAAAPVSVPSAAPGTQPALRSKPSAARRN